MYIVYATETHTEQTKKRAQEIIIHCFVINNPPTPHFHYANIAYGLSYGTQFSNGLCYTQAVQLYFVQRPAKCPLLQSTVVF